MASKQQLQDRLDQLNLIIAQTSYTSPKFFQLSNERDEVERLLRDPRSWNVAPNYQSSGNYTSSSLGYQPSNPYQYTSSNQNFPSAPDNNPLNPNNYQNQYSTPPTPSQPTNNFSNNYNPYAPAYNSPTPTTNNPYNQTQNYLSSPTFSQQATNTPTPPQPTNTPVPPQPINQNYTQNNYSFPNTPVAPQPTNTPVPPQPLNQNYSSQSYSSQPVFGTVVLGQQSGSVSFPSSQPGTQSLGYQLPNAAVPQSQSLGGQSNYQTPVQPNPQPSQPARPALSSSVSGYSPASTHQSNIRPLSSQNKSQSQSTIQYNNSQNYPATPTPIKNNFTTDSLPSSTNRNPSIKTPTASMPSKAFTQIRNEQNQQQKPPQNAPVRTQPPSMDKFVATKGTTEGRSKRATVGGTSGTSLYNQGSANTNQSKRPLPALVDTPPPIIGGNDDLSAQVLTKRENLLLQRELKLERKQMELEEFERQLNERKVELDLREKKLNDFEALLHQKKREQIKNLQVVNTGNKKEISLDFLPEEMKKVLICQRAMKKCILRTKFHKGSLKPISLLQLVEFIKEKEEVPDRKENKHRWSALKEILSTEKQYVSDLKLICHYMTSLYSVSTDLGIKFGDIQEIFSNIEEIEHINSTFLEKLQRGFSDRSTCSPCICDSFYAVLPDLPKYAHFFNGFDKSLEIRARLYSNAKVKTYLQGLQIHSSSPSLDLDSLLIKPCQRLPRYKLLVEAVIKHTSDSHCEYERLNDVQKKLDEVIVGINEEKRESENLLKVEALAARIHSPGFSLADGVRKLVFQAPLCIVNEKRLKYEWKPNKTGYLFTDVLLLTQMKTKLTLMSSQETIESRMQITPYIRIIDQPDSPGFYFLFLILFPFWLIQPFLSFMQKFGTILLL